MPIDNEDDGLTPEERAALGEDDGAGTNANADDANTDTDTDEGTKAAEDAAAAEADKAKQDEAAAAATDEAAPEAATTEAQQAAPILVAQPVADAEARLAEIASKKDEILTQFDDGDITGKEYQKQLEELSKQERKIEFEVHEAQLAAKLEQQRLQNDWNATCNTFIEKHTAYKEMPWLYMQLDAKVRELATKPETAQWSGQKFLDEAHKELREKYKFPEADAKPSDTQRQPRELPPNLAKVPAANLEDTNGGRFAVLDRLANSDPIAYEEALNKLSATERDAYLAA